MAEGWAFCNVALENDPWLSGFCGAHRVSPGYVKQEYLKLMGEAEPVLQQVPEKKVSLLKRLTGALDALAGRKD